MKLVSITRGDASCGHCDRKIRVLCTVEIQDGSRKTVGSSCVAKYVPELQSEFERKFSIFNKAERRSKRILAAQNAKEARLQEFMAKIKGSRIPGDYLLSIVIPEMAHGLTSLLLDDGFETTEDEFILSAPTAEVMDKALETYEGLAPVTPYDPANLEAVEFLQKYTGRFDFFISLKQQLEAKGYLSDKQLDAVKRSLAKSAQHETAPILLKDAVITVGQWFGKYAVLRHTGLSTAHFNFQVFKILRETEKAYLLEMKATGTPTKCCSVCGIILTNEVSIAIGIGPICRDKVGVDDSQALNIKLETQSVVFTAWVPKKTIKDSINFIEGQRK